MKSLLNKCHQSNFLTGVVLRFFQPVICCSSVFTGGCNSAESVRYLNQKIFKFETFCKRGDPVWQEGRTRDHGWFIPNMVSEIFLDHFGEIWTTCGNPTLRCQRSIESEPVGLRWKIHSKWVFGSSLSQDANCQRVDSALNQKVKAENLCPKIF